MTKKLAVWLMQQNIAVSLPQGIQFVESASKNEYPEGLSEELEKQLELRMTLGSPISHESALSYLKDRLATGEKLIKFWESNPKDTNAIFFLRKCSEIEMEG